MRYFLFLFFTISSACYAQKLDVLLIGVSHNYGKYPVQDFSSVHHKIRQFNPQAFFGEFLSQEDEQLVMDYWCKQANISRIKTLRGNRDIPASLLQKKVDSLKKMVDATPNNYMGKVDLAHALYLMQDVGNAHFQFWQVVDELNKNPDPKLAAYLKKVLSPDLDTVGRSMRRLKTSEYAHIAFPMMKELGIKELISMDCQDYDLNWNASWAAFDAKFEIFRKDTAMAFRKELKTYLTKINEGFAKYDSVEKTSNKVTEWLNTEQASLISASGDFYLPEMYSMKNFPREEMLSKLHWWMMRNKGMCDNVVTRARNKGVKRVVVIAGANHRKFMQEIFEKMPNVTVKNINEVKTN